MDKLTGHLLRCGAPLDFMSVVMVTNLDESTGDFESCISISCKLFQVSWTAFLYIYIYPSIS